jgi:NTE family protein
MRQIAPLSPALHLGAERILVIGVRQEDPGSMTRNGSEPERPTLAQIGGHVLSSIFLDALEADLERLQRINQTVSRIPMEHREQGGVRLREVEAMHIAPSLNLSEMAFRHRHRFPRPVRFLLRGVGAWRRGGGDLVSYLLFEREYCEELIALGYADARARRDELAVFLGLGKP